jgi:tRNA(Glu) U13 pseudouridine synthase TruD
VLDAFATGPLPGTSRLQPSPDVLAEEQTWADADPHSSGIRWSWFTRSEPLESPGERRPLLMAFREPPTIAIDGDTTWLSFALPSGGYATEVLSQVGIAIPADRRG